MQPANNGGLVEALSLANGGFARLIAIPDRRQPVAMGFADQPPIDLPHADADAAVRRQVAVELRRARHRAAYERKQLIASSVLICSDRKRVSEARQIF